MGSATLSWVLFSVVLIGCGDVIGFKQELWLYLEEGVGGNALYFSKPESDLSRYNDLLPLVTHACAMGRWDTFYRANFRTVYDYIGSTGDDRLVCYKFNATNIQSLRHWAANDTDTDAISLYSGAEYAGDEILVEGQAYTGITHNITSLAASGTASWEIFEGQHLNGKSFCVTVPYEFRGETYNFQWYYNLNELFNIATVGSVFKGCDAAELAAYKSRHN